MSKHTFSFLIILLITLPLLSHSNIPKPFTLEFPAKVTHTLLNINNWSGWIFWDGRSGNDPMGNSGVIYPRGTAGVIFTDGIIWGGFTNDGISPSLRVGGQTYFIGTQPGRIISQGVAQDPTDPEVQIYRIRSDYLTVSDLELRLDAAELNLVDPALVTQAMIDSVRAQYARAWNQWPGDLGAPYYDLNGNNSWDPGIDEPGLLNAQQVSWFVCNDLDPNLTTMLYGSPPMGIELQVTMWGYKSGGSIGQAAYRRYRFINKSGFTIDSMYVSQWSDPDVGSYTNDVVGCDSILDIGFAYNGNPTDNLFDPFGIPPPAIGYAILQGPMVHSPGDTALFNFHKIADFRNLPMTSFGYTSVGNPEWGHPSFQTYEGTIEWYNWLKGFLPTPNLLNPYPFTHRSTGIPTKFPLNGDPVTGIGDIDGQPGNFPAGSRTMVLCSGPFTMQDGDTQEVVLAITGGLGTDYIQSVAEMKNNIIWIRNHYGSAIRLPAGQVNVTYPNDQQSNVHCQMNLQAFSSVNSCDITFKSQQGSEPSFNLTLYDDGQHGDSLAGDNIWGNQTTITNRQYAYQADVIVNWSTQIDTFAGSIEHIRLRPQPKFQNWQITWENGLQDNLLNSAETVHYGFTVQNIDQVNSINHLKVGYGGYSGEYLGGIPPGGMVSPDSLFLVVIGPLTGDSMTVQYFVEFDGHGFEQSVTFPVVNWSPPPTWGDTLWVRSQVGVKENVFPVVAEPASLNGHQYLLTFHENTTSGNLYWQLFDQTSGELKVDNGIPSNDPCFPHPIVDGIIFIVRELELGFKNFLVIANAAGPIDPAEMGCFAFNNNGFPLLYNARYPNGTDRPTPGVQQSTNLSDWGIHTGMISSNDGSYDFFLSRVARNDNWDRIIPYDYEMRFTAAGGYACWAFEDEDIYRVPFELWNIGVNTPDNASDDYRIIPWILNDTGPGAPDDSIYNINPTDHVVSGGTNDPYMDWVYWSNPENTSPGTTGYDQFVSDALAGVYNLNSPEVMARTVLVNLNGGDVNDPIFPGNLDAMIPEEGTIFRIITSKPNFPGDTLLVIASFTSLASVTTPYTYELWQNYPNPFNPTTTITFSLQKAGKVQLEIFNVLGQRVRTLLSEWTPAGKHRRIWNATNDSGQFLGSGIFFYRITAGEFVKTHKMILLK